MPGAKVGAEIPFGQLVDEKVAASKAAFTVNLHALANAGIPLGGEPSGHVIFRSHASTGDGLLTEAFSVLPEVLGVPRERVARSRGPLHR